MKGKDVSSLPSFAADVEACMALTPEEIDGIRANLQASGRWSEMDQTFIVWSYWVLSQVRLLAKEGET